MIKILYSVLQLSGAIDGRPQTKILNNYDELVKTLHRWIMNGVNVSVGIEVSHDIWAKESKKFLDLYKYASLDKFSLVNSDTNLYRLNIFAVNY